MNKKKIEKFLKITGSVLGVSFLALNIIGGKKKIHWKDIKLHS